MREYLIINIYNNKIKKFLPSDSNPLGNFQLEHCEYPYSIPYKEFQSQISNLISSLAHYEFPQGLL